MPGKITMRNPYIKRLPERPQGIQTEVIEHFMTSRRKVGKYIATSLHKKKKKLKREQEILVVISQIHLDMYRSRLLFVQNFWKKKV